MIKAEERMTARGHIMLAQDEIKWTEGPASLPPGLRWLSLKATLQALDLSPEGLSYHRITPLPRTPKEAMKESRSCQACSISAKENR